MGRKIATQARRPVLVCMDKEEDVVIVQNVLAGESADPAICLDIQDLCRKISDQAEAAVVSGDMLSEKANQRIAETLDRQPDWSDLPIILSAAEGADSDITMNAVRDLGYVLVLERPFTPAALRNTLRIAFRSRERQRWVRDLTAECDQTMNELRESRGQLEQKVAERTAELAQRESQLRRLIGELILSEQRERRRMAAILHDQLQQLLVSAKYRAASLSRTEDAIAKLAAHEIEQLLGDAIEASRSLTSDLAPPIVRESGLRTAMEWLAGFMAAQHGLAVRLRMEDEFRRLDDNGKALLFDATRELLANALRHGKVQEAEVEVHRAGEDMLEVAVSDRGAGFDPSQPKPGGFGLLKIRQRVEMIGGRLDVESSAGKGSRIAVRVPAPPETPKTTPQPETAIPKIDRPVGSMIRILIVDDHAVMRQGLSTSIGQEPDIAIVGEAADGKVAIEKARALHPDVILMDLGMPKMGGIEATRIIHSEMPAIRVIGLSMFEERERANAMIEAGAVAYLSKSCSVETLTSTIRRSAGKPELPLAAR